MPFFKVLKKAFQWIDECEEALAKLDEAIIAKSLDDGGKAIPLLSNV